MVEELEEMSLKAEAKEISDYYTSIKQDITEEVFHLPVSPIDVIRQLITAEKFVAPKGEYLNILLRNVRGGHTNWIISHLRAMTTSSTLLSGQERSVTLTLSSTHWRN